MSEKSKYIKLNDVRLSYPNIFRPTAYRPKGAVVSDTNIKPKYSATFILDKVKHAKDIASINDRIDELLAENKYSRNKVKTDHMCFKDGDTRDIPEYENSYILVGKSIKRFPIVGQDAVTPVTEEDALIYGGCYVTTYINLFYYDKAAIGIGANIKSIQYRSKGESFGDAPHDITGAFDPVTDEDNLF